MHTQIKQITGLLLEEYEPSVRGGTKRSFDNDVTRRYLSLELLSAIFMRLTVKRNIVQNHEDYNVMFFF